MKKLPLTILFLSAVLLAAPLQTCVARTHTQDGQLKSAVKSAVLIKQFTQKWMTHKMTDVCLQEEATEHIVVHRNSWDVATRYLMFFRISTDTKEAGGRWIIGRSLTDNSILEQPELLIWDKNHVSAMLLNLSVFYSEHYAKVGSMAPYQGAAGIGPSRATDTDAPWDKNNAELFNEFYSELLAIYNNLPK